jgi:hypothetical protein
MKRWAFWVFSGISVSNNILPKIRQIFADKDSALFCEISGKKYPRWRVCNSSLSIKIIQAGKQNGCRRK